MVERQLARTLVDVACKQVDTALRFKEPKLKKIKEIEDLYAGKRPPQLKGIFQIALPIVPGYIDTLLSKIDELPNLSFNRREEADLKAARKITALWNAESGPDQGNWALQDRLAKIMAIYSGRGIYKFYAQSDPKYQSNMEAIDYTDFYCQPKGGPVLEKHLFLGQLNIFRTKSDIESNSKSGLYDRVNSILLANRPTSADETQVTDIQGDKDNRMKSYGLDPEANNYVGQPTFNLTEHYMDYEGERYYLLFDRKSKLWLRCEKLSDVFESNLFPYASFATHEDASNFWSKGPTDDVVEPAKAMERIFNQAFSNVYKRGMNMRAFNSKVFKDPEQLVWSPDGLAMADLAENADIRQAIMDLKPEDNSGSVERLISFLDTFIGKNTGVTDGAKGTSDKDKKVGIFFGEIEQAADRISNYTKSYVEAQVQIGVRYVYGVKEHLTEPLAVKIIGIDGIEWDQIRKNDITEFDIAVSGGSKDAELQEVKTQKKSKTLIAIANSPQLMENINKTWFLEALLQIGDFDDTEIKRAMDTRNDGDTEIMAEAAKAIEDITQGKEVKINDGATPAFIKKITRFVRDNEMEPEVEDALMTFAEAHIPIARENVRKEAMSVAIKMKTDQGQGAGVRLGSPAAPESLETEEPLIQ